MISEMERSSMERGLAAIKTVCNRCAGFFVRKKCPGARRSPAQEQWHSCKTHVLMRHNRLCDGEPTEPEHGESVLENIQSTV